METTYRDWYNLQQAYSWCQTNYASGYEASEAKSFQEHEETSKSARDFRIIHAQNV